MYFFFQAEDGIRDRNVTGVQTCALPICKPPPMQWWGLTALPHLPFPEANVPVLKALQLPEQWFVLTAPSAKAEQQLQQALDTGQVGGVYLRGDYSETQLKRLVLQCQQALCLTLDRKSVVEGKRV